MRLKTLVCLVLGLLVAACAGGGGGGPVITSGERYAVDTSAVEDYRLGVGDKVKMTVFNEETLSGEFSVNADGTLSLPLVGDVPAVGKGVAEVARLVQARLADGYLRDPKVSMEITAYRPFFILGEVKQPGQYPYAAGMTVTNAIAVAQGYTPRAQKTTVYIRRSSGAMEQAFKLSPDLRVWPGDTIRIGERYF